MTSDKDLKRVVRARMEKTGESYTTARAQILSRPPRKRASTAARPAAPRLTNIPAPPPLAYANVAGMEHPAIAMLVSDKYGVAPWWTQAVTVGYERIKGLRARGQRRDGSYEASKSRTFDVPVATLFDAWANAAARRRWLGTKDVKVRTATRPRSMRLAWSDSTVIALWFTAKGKKSTVSVQHTKLRDRATADSLKKYWSEQLQALSEFLARQHE